MLLNSHNLYSVITILRHTRQHVLPELIIGTNFLLIRTHTNMAFINQKGRFFRLKFPVFKFIWDLWIPYLGTKDLCFRILNYPTYPSRNTLARTAIPLNQQLEQVTMTQKLFGQRYFPNTIRFLFQLIFFILLPIVERTDQINSCGVGGPFPEYPTFCRFM